MRKQLIAALSLILAVTSACQKKTASTALNEETPPPLTETPTAMETPTPTIVASGLIQCKVNNPVEIELTTPGNLGDTCLMIEPSSPSNSEINWKWKAPAPAGRKFKVEWTTFRPEQPPPTYPYNLSVQCPSYATSCSTGNAAGTSTAGTAYYKVTIDQGGPILNGRIIIVK